MNCTHEEIFVLGFLGFKFQSSVNAGRYYELHIYFAK